MATMTSTARMTNTFSLGGYTPSSKDHALDPLTELRITPDKAKNISTLQLANKGIRAIHPNFQHFVNLEALWLSGNKLRKIENLVPADYDNNETPVADRVHNSGCLRLRSLFLSNNALTTLSGDLRHLRFLEVLLLANNRLTNMEVVSSFLKHLCFLQQLDLFGNPLTEEQHYREYFIFHHPSVRILDRTSVEDQERFTAKRMFGSATAHDVATHVAFGRSLSKYGTRAAERQVNPISPSVLAMERKLGELSMTRKAKERATLLEEQRRIREAQDRQVAVSCPPAGTEGEVVAALDARKHAAMDQYTEALFQRLLGITVQPQELQAIQSAFGERRVRAQDCIAICEMLSFDAIKIGMRGTLEIWVTESAGGLQCMDVLRKLMNSSAFIEDRIDGLYAQTRAAITQGKETKSFHQSINVLSEHRKTLGKS